MEQLRRAGVARMQDAILVVLERSGSISVLTEAPDDHLIEDVERVS